LFCPSEQAVRNLAKEGITRGVHVAGDVMADALRHFGGAGGAGKDDGWLREVGATPGQYFLATVHRAQNTDDAGLLAGIVRALGALSAPVILPAHPRLREALKRHGIIPGGNVRLIDPVGYIEMIALERHARAILTDSGGVQKEAYWLGVPCVTMRDETEWVETVEAGWNVLTGADETKIMDAVRRLSPPAARPPLYGEGGAAQAIVDHLSTAA
jgi:UDP-N-acetylglucosamine 2-epimerase